MRLQEGWRIQRKIPSKVNIVRIWWLQIQIHISCIKVKINFRKKMLVRSFIHLSKRNITFVENSWFETFNYSYSAWRFEKLFWTLSSILFKTLHLNRRWFWKPLLCGEQDRFCWWNVFKALEFQWKNNRISTNV